MPRRRCCRSPDRAGPLQIPGVRRAMAHGSHGFAQQGNVAVIFEAV